MMKKVLALALAGTMLIATPVMAAESPSAAVVASDSSSDDTSAVAASVEAAAQAEGKTVEEYANNAVISVASNPDQLPTALPKGGVAINGAKTNQAVTLTKPTAAEVSLGKQVAAATAGAKLISAFGTKSAITTDNACINVYVKGLPVGSKIVGYMLVNGQLVPVPVVAYKDHVIAAISTNAKIFIVEYPAGVEAPAFAAEVTAAPAV